MNKSIPNSISAESLDIILVDDEKDTCTHIQSILLNQASVKINIAGIAHNTKDAEKMIALLKPDALLLDIEMPGENAFQFLGRIGAINFDIIFITAYDEYAVRAFQLNAVDYLLKPMDEEDLLRAIKRLQERKSYTRFLESQHAQLDNLFEQLKDNKTPNKIFLKSRNTIEVVSLDELIYIEAMGSYCKVVFTKGRSVKQVIVSYPLSTYASLLSEKSFFRVHKSYLVNSNMILEIKHEDKPAVLLKDGSVLPVGKRRMTALISFLKT